MKTFFIIFILIINTAAMARLPQDNSSQLQNQIQNLKINLQQDQSTRADLQTQLQTLETNAGLLAYQLHQTRHQLAKQNVILESLNQEQAQYEAKLALQQNELAQQVRAVYMFGQQEYLKVLFSQQNPSQVSRILTYYHYLIQGRVEILAGLNNTLQQLLQTKQQIQESRQKLLALQTQQQEQSSQLDKTKAYRKQVLQSFDAKIQTGNQQLDELLANKKALEHVVKQIEVTKTYALPAGVPFAGLRNKLAWPTRGRIIEDFQTPIENSELRSSGVVISAPEGQNVYAIAPGRVVFANWLPGYGLMMIVDHGNGYMSLYGRNGALYKKTGDSLSAGDLIATVGQSGGYTKSSLYFEIRQNGVAVNPAQWCAKQFS